MDEVRRRVVLVNGVASAVGATLARRLAGSETAPAAKRFMSAAD